MYLHVYVHFTMYVCMHACACAYKSVCGCMFVFMCRHMHMHNHCCVANDTLFGTTSEVKNLPTLKCYFQIRTKYKFRNLGLHFLEMGGNCRSSRCGEIA